MTKSRYRRAVRVALFHAVTGTPILAAATNSAFAQLPAFPGADGAAGTVTGGRGGLVYHVTRLNAAIDDPARNDPGTLRYGLNNANFPSGPRTIVFDVSGTIHLGRLAQPGWDPNGNGWDTQSRIDIPSNITVAGQTAPGKGIVIMGGVVKPGANNSIIRNLTIAPGYGNRNFFDPGDPGPTPGDFPDSYVYDALDISGTNIMIDHVTAAYATDETISANELANNVTIQYSNISQGQNYPQADAEGGGNYTGHALGSLLQAGSNAKMSIHHNLYAHLKGRLPRVGSEVGTGAHNDFRNNVFYNWLSTAGGGAGGQPSFNKFVGNFYLAGDGGDDPVGGTSTDITNRPGGTGIFNGSNSTGTRVYHAGNLKDINKDADALDGVALTNADFGSSLFVTDASFAVPYFGATDSATAAYNQVLNYAGARWWTRDGVIDSIDERIINEVRTGTGQIKAWADDPFNPDVNEGTEWRAMVNTPSETRPGSWDGDQDGMPFTWEQAHGLSNITQDHNGDFDADGYTNLEEYLNEVAAWPAPQPIVFANANGTGRFEEINNWDIRWQPSRYDEARINSGTVTINSVGQHAGTLAIGASAGNTATLAISAGWIDVANQLKVGAAGNGHVVQSGGIVYAPSIVVGSATGSLSTYTYAAGALVTSNLQLVGGGRMTLTTGSDKLLKLNTLGIDAANGSTLDLSDNAMMIDFAPGGPSPKSQVEQWIASGRAGGAWTGAGITSTAARERADGATTLGLLDGAEYRSIYGPGATFAGQPVDDSSVLVTYTWYGDADFSGVVDFDDYVRIDGGFNTGASGWLNGDFDYSGTIDFDDYVLIDLAFNSQNGTLRQAVNWLSGDDRSFDMRSTPGTAKVLEHYQQFGLGYAQGFLAAVPEPSALVLAGIGIVGLGSHRRRRREAR